MKLIVVFFHFLCLRLIHAINVQDLPQCVQHCLSTSTSSQRTCSVIDIACLCSTPAYVAALSCCLDTDCSADEQAVAIQFNKQECNAVNETAPDFVGCSPAGLSSALASMSLTPLAPTSTASASATSASSSTVDSRVSTVTGDTLSETQAITTASLSTASFVGRPLMTGSCTVPYFAIMTDLSGMVIQFPEVGCSDQRTGCCPWNYEVGDDPALLTRCPQDYFTTANACCPLGYQIYYTAVGGQTPCYSDPVTKLVPASSPTIDGLTLITDHVFTQKYDLVVEEPGGGKGFPLGAKIAIPVAWTVVFIVVFILVRKWMKARRKRKDKAASRSTTFPPEEPAFQMQMARVPTTHELDSPPPQSGVTGIANGWPMSPAISPPAYGTNKQLPTVIKQAAPQELPGSTFIHEHHPAFSSAGAHSEATASSPPMTPTQSAAGAERRSPPLSSVRPRSGSQSPVFVSPLGSPRLPKT